jgi:hypothetical protein
MFPPGRARLATSPASSKEPPAAHDDGDRGGGLLGHHPRRGILHHEHLDRELDQLGGQSGKPVATPFRPAPLNGDGVALHPPPFAQPVPERIEIGHGRRGRRREVQSEKSDPWNLSWLLGNGGQW